MTGVQTCALPILNTVSGGIAVKDDTVFLDKIALRTAETSLLVDGAIQHYLATPILNLQISSDKTTVAEFARLVPALDGSRLQPSFNVKADGPLDRLKAEVNIQSSGGMVSGTVIADLVTPGQSVAGDLSLKHLDLSSFLGGKAVKSDITADTRLDLRAEVLSKIDGLRGTMAIESPRLVRVSRRHSALGIAGRTQLLISCRFRSQIGRAHV